MEIEFEIYEAKVTVDFDPELDDYPVGWNYATDAIVYKYRVAVEINSVKTADGRDILPLLKSDWFDDIKHECLLRAKSESYLCEPIYA